MNLLCESEVEARWSKVTFSSTLLYKHTFTKKNKQAHKYTTLQHYALSYKLNKVMLTMYKGPFGQYANYIDEGMERANDSQSVKCFYCLPARVDPLTQFDDPQDQRSPLLGSQRALPCCWSERGVAMVTALAEEWQGVASRRRERGHCGCTEQAA